MCCYFLKLETTYHNVYIFREVLRTTPSYIVSVLPFAFLPPANEVWGKVIFSEACVKNSVDKGRGVGGIPACIAGGIPACLSAGVGGGGNPSMPCRFPGPHPGGS